MFAFAFFFWRYFLNSKSSGEGKAMATKQNAFDILLDDMRQIVREEIERAIKPLTATAEHPEQRESEWLRADDLAKKYNLPKTLFEEKGREGEIQRTRPGRHVLFNVRDVERFLQSYAGGGNNKDH